MSVTARVAQIRHWLNLENLDALIIPSTDPHNSEYTLSAEKRNSHF